VGGGPAVGKGAELFEDIGQHTVEIFHHIRVRESDRGVATRQQQGVTPLINRWLVCPTVYLNDQGFGRAEEIRNERRDGDLSSKLESFEL
jgi:hypothetical protein